MRAVVQRVTQARVDVDGDTVGEIGTGLMVLIGITHDDTAEKAKAMAAKVWRLRILRDEKSAEETGAGILVVSQFTLYGDTRKGRRPTWAAVLTNDTYPRSVAPVRIRAVSPFGWPTQNDIPTGNITGSRKTKNP